jgi:glutamine amidotransferase-like uncharacterized protein
MKSKIFVYLDDGVAPDTFVSTVDMLKKLFPKKLVISIDAYDVINGSWQEDAALFVIPGGADLFYAKKLNGKGNANIKSFVTNGGKFLGICAGAYYASSEVEFELGGSLEVIGTRELGFFPAKTIGPALSHFSYNSNEGVSAAIISFNFSIMKMHTTQLVKLYHHGGGFFENASVFSNVKVLASYIIPDRDQLPAIILVEYGKGKVLLSGVHFEIDPSHLNTEDPYLENIIPELNISNNARENMIDYLFKWEMHMYDDLES